MGKPLFELKRIGYNLKVFDGFIEENVIGMKNVIPIANISDFFVAPFGTVILTFNNGKKKNLYLKKQASEFLSVVSGLMKTS